MKYRAGSVALAAVLLAGAAVPRMALAVDSRPDTGLDRLTSQVRHELVMLPYLGVFDNLEFKIDGNDTVVLSGQVVRPTLKSAAERVVKRVEGIATVVNNVEVLPLSRYDDRVRLATYYALFSRPGLDRYSWGALPSIRIVVRNGNVTLAGVVSTQSDKDLAGILANGVSGVFSVRNDLRVEKRS